MSALNARIDRRTSLQWMGVAAAALPALSWSAPAGQRLISLSGALTEIIYLLDAQELLVGTDTTSLYPDAATRTRKVGYMRQLAAEGVLSLRPDVVIGTQEAGPAVAIDQIRQAGVQVELVPVRHDWAEVQAKVQLTGRVTGRVQQAKVLQALLDERWQQVRAQVAREVRRPRALFMLSHAGAPQVAGQGTAADALIRFAGAQNAITEFKGYRALTAEAMAAAAPDVLLNTTQGIEALGGEEAFWKRPELALTPAFQRRALVSLEASQLLGFGPRLPDAVRTTHERMLALTA
ncbi:ABC transporter substrate-binding protein [Diaphorobacter sp.]|uniref:heme/hemin ABC transporter substrate-binding protein n=1 Tax=Diaphorobacter sp. TaxID=1934310 RepID=UPI0028AB6B7B|nr:ABC transporter substrate-binding protein [Diaphorobacter sp.]